MVETIAKVVLENGGPLAAGLLAGLLIGLYLWRMERTERRELTEQVLALTSSQVASNSENKALLQSLKELLAQIASRI